MRRLLFALLVTAITTAARADAGICRQEHDSSAAADRLPFAGGAISRSDALFDRLTKPVTKDYYGWLYQSGSDTAATFNSKLLPPTWKNFDGFRSVVTAMQGTTIVNTTGFNAYMRNLTSELNRGDLLQHNVVGYSSSVSCEVSGCSSWALNPTITDTLAASALPKSQAYPAKLVASEFDITVKNPGSNVTGITILGSSMVQPSYAQAFDCGGLGGPAQWTHCFVVGDGVASSDGLYLGSIGTSGKAYAPSTTINMVWYGPASTPSAPKGGQLKLQAVLGALNVTDIYKANGLAFAPSDSGSAPQIFPSGSTADIDLAMTAKGKGAIKLNSPVSTSSSLVAGTYMRTSTYIENLTTPASSSAICTAGQFTDDANYHYVCVATNTWKRVALSDF